LEKQGVKSLDYIIGTHPDADHIGGLDVVAYKFDFHMILMPDYEKDTKTYTELVDVIKGKNQKITYPIPGTSYSLGEAKFTILAPISDDYGSNANNYSIAFRLTYGETSFLFTGDAEQESESEMLSSGEELAVDVYKVAHHGSDSASTQEFMKVISPKYAVISCKEGNSYGHPHAEVLNRLRQMGIEIFRTDEQGSIIAVSDGKHISWSVSPSTSWQTGERKESDREDIPEKDQTVSQQETESVSYILNTNTKKFHKVTCKSVSQIQEENREESGLKRDKLIKEGYQPCKNCSP
jgi:competence protein ComEC